MRRGQFPDVDAGCGLWHVFGVAVVPYPWAALPVADPAAARLAAWVSALDGMDLGLVGGLRWLGSATTGPGPRW